MSEATRWRVLLDTVATVAMALAAGVLVWSVLVASHREGPRRDAEAQGLPSEPVSLDGAAVRGSSSARVAIIEYADFACPHCGTFARETLPLLMRTYVTTGKVLLAFRHLPLENLHPTARFAAEAAECAGREGKFWEMHDRLFEVTGQFELASLKRSAETLGLDRRHFAACLEGGLATAKVRQDAAAAAAHRVTGTPAFFVGVVQPGGGVKVRRRLSGTRPYAAFAQILDELLSNSAGK